MSVAEKGCQHPRSCQYPGGCDCTIRTVEAPPLAPLTTEQERFIWLHARRTDYVVKWHWLLGGSQLRAFTERGVTATISRRDLDDLVERGLVRNVRATQYELTAEGWKMGVGK